MGKTTVYLFPDSDGVVVNLPPRTKLYVIRQPDCWLVNDGFNVRVCRDVTEILDELDVIADLHQIDMTVCVSFLRREEMA